MGSLFDRVRVGISALMVSAALAACGGAEPGAQPGQAVADGRLTVALEFAPKAGFAVDTDDAFVLSKLGVTETLVAPAADGTVAPRLATGWTQVDPRTWRFDLRAGVTFQDGTALTPDAVVTALGYVTSVTAPPRSVKGLGLSAAKDGDRAVLISTTAPDPILPQRLTSPNTAILAPAAYRPGAPPAVQGTGTGPFTLTEVDGVQSATVIRNEAYWGERPALAGAQARFIPDPTARATAVLGPFSTAALASGLVGHVQVIGVERHPADADTAQCLDIAEGDEVVVRVRHMLLGDIEPETVQVSTSMIPLVLVEGSPLAADATRVYAAFAELGITPTTMTEEVSTRMPTPEDAATLGLASGMPVLDIQRITRDQRRPADRAAAGDRYRRPCRTGLRRPANHSARRLIPTHDGPMIV